MATRSSDVFLDVSPRGQVTLPAKARKAFGIKAGDTLRLVQEEGRMVLEPTARFPIEIYTEERIAEFMKEGQATPAELRKIRKVWARQKRS